MLLVPRGAEAAASGNEDLLKVPLVPNAAYDPRKEEGRGLKEFVSSLGVMIAGPGTDIGKDISEKLANPALLAYFPDAAERERIARKIGDDVKHRYLSEGYSNHQVNAAMRAATDQLVNLVVPRVLQKEGVKNGTRARIWAGKILAPFDQCMAAAISYLEGKKCTEPLESALMKNVGLAMTYELSRQEFGAATAGTRPADYNHCLHSESPDANARVRTCAVAGVRKAASAFGRARVLAVASKQMPPAAATQLASQVMPAFDKCIQAASERKGFVKCGDKLIETAGTAIAGQAVLTDKRIITYFPALQDRNRVADAGRDAFARCMAGNEKASRRDANGTLQTDNCVTFVRLETARTVAGEVFRATILQNMPFASPEVRAGALKSANERLADCWDSLKSEQENNSCLREVVKRTAADLAGNRLNAQLPADARDPKLRAQLLTGFAGCLEKRLPADLLHAQSANVEASACGNETVRAASLAVAEIKVRAALKGKLDDPAAVDELVEKRVRGEFGDCLGAQPGDSRIDPCSLTLQKNVALDSAATLVPGKVDDFFRKGGGLESYGVTSEQREAILDSALAGHRACIEKEVTSFKAQESAAEINGCFKETVRNVVLQLGPLELAKQAAANGLDVTTSSFRQTTSDLGSTFGACLDKRRNPKFTLDDYLAGLDSCQTELTKTFTSQLAKRELAGIARQVLGEEADALESRLGAELDQCMTEAQDSAATVPCVENLRREGTVAIAKAGVHARAAKELNGQVPAELTALEGTLDACVADNKKGLHACAMEYVRGSTKMLGHLVLATQIAKELGDKKMASLSSDIKAKLEDPFSQCVDSVQPPLAQKVLDDLDVCGNRLTKDALDYLIHHKTQIAIESVLSFFKKPQNPSPNPPASGATDAVSQEELTGMIAGTMLCLNDRPSSLEPFDNLQPDSTENRLLQLIGSYVSYDVKNARGEFKGVLSQVADELKGAGPVGARRKLLALMTDQGAVDQLIRGMIKADMQKSLAGSGIPANVTAKLTDKSFLDATLTGDAMANLRPKMAVGVLEPILIDGNSLSSPGVTRALLSVRSDALETLLANPDLGADELVREQVRQALRN